MISWMIRPLSALCEIVGTQNCFSTLCHTPYTNIKTSAQNAPKCTTGRQKNQQQKILGRGHSPLSSPSPVGEGIPLHRPHPSALGVPVPFHLRLEHWEHPTVCHNPSAQFLQQQMVSESENIKFLDLTVDYLRYADYICDIF